MERKVRVFSEWGINLLFGRDTTGMRHVRDPRRSFKIAAGDEVDKAKARL